MKKSYKDLLAEANAVVETIPAAAAMELLNDENVCFIDIRDSSEIERDGKIPGATHIPRGSLEARVDPTSSLHDPIFAAKKKFVFY
jgi:rhodanese-related sulfurtransferase